MKLQKLHIKNYKSIVDLEIVEPNPFTVFAGPNGAGKSNIFEALEFFSYVNSTYSSRGSNINGISQKFIYMMFNGSKLLPFTEKDKDSFIELEIFVDFLRSSILFNGNNSNEASASFSDGTFSDHNTDHNIESGPRNIIFKNFSRLFIGKQVLERIAAKSLSNESLTISAKNLEEVLNRLLDTETKRENIKEYLEALVPGFENIQIRPSDLKLLIYEKGIEEPFTEDLISDGTYNILCLLTALFQSDEPQFLCIEEPENGLNPYVVQEFVNLCRLMCEEKGHYIWLNTHSQTLVRALREEELILVDKKNGATQIKQFDKGEFHGLKADEAWLTNSLGAGIPW